MIIKHLVLSGGGHHGIKQLGALLRAQVTLFERSDIETVYGTSIGSVVLALWLMKIPTDTVYDFVINKPWDKAYALDPNIISRLLGEKGVLDKNIIIEILGPIIRSKLLDIDITLKQLYDITNIDFHIIATELNTLTHIDFSHTSHPDLKLIDAVYMSSSIPFVFKPCYYNGSYVLDGALSAHFPIELCIENGAKPDNILGIKVCGYKSKDSDEDTPLSEYTLHLLNKMCMKIYAVSDIEIPYLISLESETDTDGLLGAVSDPLSRIKLWQYGEDSCNRLQSGVE